METVQILLRLSLVILLVTGCTQRTEPPQPGLKPVASVKEIMDGLVAHTSAQVFSSTGTIVDETGTHEIVPPDDAAWAEVGYAAMGLAETGNLLMLQGRAKDREDWSLFSRQLMDRAVEAARAAEAKDPAQLLEAGGRIYEVCENCHRHYIPSGLE